MTHSHSIFVVNKISRLLIHSKRKKHIRFAETNSAKKGSLSCETVATGGAEEIPETMYVYK